MADPNRAEILNYLDTVGEALTLLLKERGEDLTQLERDALLKANQAVFDAEVVVGHADRKAKAS